MRLLNTLYVDDHGVLVSVRHRSLEVRRNRALVGRYPMGEMEAVVLTGRAGITTEAIARCVGEGIRVASLHRGGGVRFMVGGPTSGNVLLRTLQMQRAAEPAVSARLARSFVAGKLQNQRRLVQRWAWDAHGVLRRFIEDQAGVVEERLRGLESATDGDRIRGIEGDATRRYFKALNAHLAGTPGFSLERRTRRPPRDPTNSLLGYLYGLLLTQAVGALDAVGLDPQVGFLHGLQPGRPSLALDLIEEFRPALAERLAVSLITRRQVDPEHFERTPGGAVYLTDEGRRTVLARYEEFRSEMVPHPLLATQVTRSQLPLTQATLLARHLRGDLPAYPPYLMER